MSFFTAKKTLFEALLRVFVHLTENKDAERWRASWAASTLVGVNDHTPHGYGRAIDLGCVMSFSKPWIERMPSKLTRYAFRAILRFDFPHAWRQRRELAQAGVIWTHTGSQYLAGTAVAKLTGIQSKIIGQTVWLLDQRSGLSKTLKSPRVTYSAHARSPLDSKHDC